MRRPPPISTRTYTLFPYTTLFRSEIFRDIILADGFAHIAGGEIDRALPAFLHLRCSRERGAVEREGLLCDRIGQYVRETIAPAHDQQVADHADRRVRHKLRFAGEGPRLRQ